MKEHATRNRMTDAGSWLLMDMFVFMLSHFLEVQRVNYVVSVSLCFVFSFSTCTQWSSWFLLPRTSIGQLPA